MSAGGPADTPHVVIVGAGFAGLWSVKQFYGTGIRVTLIDRNNYHTFPPLLYQVGASEISPEQIAYPIRSILRGRKNLSFFRGEVTSVNCAGRELVCGGMKVSFDYCILATGSVTGFFGVPGAENRSFVLKTLDDAMVLRNHILACFERAVYPHDPGRLGSLLSFIVVGGGPTGVEFAGALAELVRGPCRKDFPGLDPSRVTITLVEAGERLLPSFCGDQSRYTARRLGAMGVRVILGTAVREVAHHRVILADGSIIEGETVIWTAGVRGDIPPGEGPARDSSGRVPVLPTLQSAGFPHIYVAGDTAWVNTQGAPLPQSAPVAIQQGTHAARNVIRMIRGTPLIPFIYRDRGSMATIGRNAAVTTIGPFRLRGFVAWVMWLLVHLIHLIGFRNKLFVTINWFWNYIAFDRAVRLILPRCCDNPGAGRCLKRAGDSSLSGR